MCLLPFLLHVAFMWGNCNKKSMFCVDLFYLKINHEINILFVVLKFSARVDTYFLYNETLIDYATELFLPLLFSWTSIFLYLPVLFFMDLKIFLLVILEGSLSLDLQTL